MYAFACACRTKCLLDLKLGSLLQVVTAGCDLRGRDECRSNMIIAVHTDDFFGHILIGLHIDTVARDRDRQLIAVQFRYKLQIGKDTYDILIRYRDTENTIDLLYADGHLTRLNRVSCIDVKLRSAYLTAMEFFDQVQGTLHGHYSRIFIDTLGETHARIRDLTESL